MICDAFVSPAAFAVEIAGAGRRNFSREGLREKLVAFELRDGGGIADVVEEWRGAISMLEEKKERAGGVVAVDLIEIALSVFLDDGVAFEEFAEEDAASVAVEAREASDAAVVREDELFGIFEDFSRFSRGDGGGEFGDPRAVALGVHGAAGAEEDA